MRTSNRLRYFFIAVMILFITSLHAQKNIDSLLTVLKSSKEDTSKVITLLYLFNAHKESDMEKATLFARQSLKLSEKLGFKKGIGESYNSIGAYYDIEKAEPDTALHFYTMALKVREGIGDKKGIAASCNNIGGIYSDRGDFSKALEYHNRALKIRLELNDKSLISTYGNIGIIYNEMGDYPRSLEYYVKAAAMSEKFDHKRGMANNYNNIGLVYKKMRKYEDAIEYVKKSIAIERELGNKKGEADSYNSIATSYQDRGQLDLAIEWHTKALEMRKDIKDLRGLATTYNNLAMIWQDRNDLAKAKEHALLSLQLREENKDKKGIALSYLTLGSISNDAKEYAKGMDYAQKALELSKTLDIKNEIKRSYLLLAEISASIKDFTSAYRFRSLYDQVKDSIFNEENTEALAEMRTRYETEKKEQENQLLAKDNELKSLKIFEQATRNKEQLIILGGIIILIIAFSLLFYTRYRAKQRALLDKELMRQQELRAKAIIEAEEKERIRIAKDLHDGIGQVLSAAKLNMSSLEERLSFKDAEQERAFRSAMELVDESVKEVRSVSHSMMPNALIKQGLATAVRDFLNKINTNDKLKIDLQVTGLSDRLESTMETVLFRVLQEVMSNIIKHAQASRVSIQIIRHDEELTLMIEDNGKGFDISKLNDHNGIGLKNIQSRISYLNGTVFFDSRPGAGTTVTIEVPLNKTNEPVDKT